MQKHNEVAASRFYKKDDRGKWSNEVLSGIELRVLEMEIEGV